MIDLACEEEFKKWYGCPRSICERAYSDWEEAWEAGQSILRKELEELRKDKARLDWLSDPLNAIGGVELPEEIVKANLHSMRAAIDAAMEIKSE